MMRAHRWNTLCRVRDTQMWFVPGEVKPTTASTTPPDPIQEIIRQVEDRSYKSDLLQQGGRESEEEVDAERKAKGDAGSSKAVEKERRTAIRKAAEESQGIADSEKATAVTVHDMLRDQAKVSTEEAHVRSPE